MYKFLYDVSMGFSEESLNILRDDLTKCFYILEKNYQWGWIDKYEKETKRKIPFPSLYNTEEKHLKWVNTKKNYIIKLLMHLDLKIIQKSDSLINHKNKSISKSLDDYNKRIELGFNIIKGEMQLLKDFGNNIFDDEFDNWEFDFLIDLANNLIQPLDIPIVIEEDTEDELITIPL